MNQHADHARELLGMSLGEIALQRTDMPSPEVVGLAQAYALLAVAEHLEDISAELTMLRQALGNRG